MTLTLTFDEPADDATRAVIEALCNLHLVVDIEFEDSTRVGGVLDHLSAHDVLIEEWDPVLASATGVLMSYPLDRIRSIHVY